MQDSARFVELYQAQYPRVLAYARRRLATLADAEDCAAEVFKLAWQQETIPSVGWLFVTAKNITYSVRRKNLRLTQIAARIATEQPDQSDPDDRGVLAALDGLNESERELLMSYYWDDLSGTQCAQLLGCSVAAIWVRLHRARQHLKAVLLKDRVRDTPAPTPHPIWQGESL